MTRVLVTNDDCFIKGPALRQAKNMLGEGLLTSEGDFHHRQRRLAQPAFHPLRVATYANAMTEFAQRMSAGWRDRQVLDVHEQTAIAREANIPRPGLPRHSSPRARRPQTAIANMQRRNIGKGT